MKLLCAHLILKILIDLRFFTLLCVLLLFGCKENEEAFPKPDNLMKEQIYIDVFYELELIKVYQNTGIPDSEIDSLSTLVYQKYGTNRSSFLESHRYYQTQLSKQQERIDLVIEKIEETLTQFEEPDSSGIDVDSTAE